MSCGNRCGCGGMMRDCFSDEEAEAWDRYAARNNEMMNLRLEEARLRVKKLKQEVGEESPDAQMKNKSE